MTRISATVRPSELCDQMLIAEHREIVRIPNCIKSGKAKVNIEKIPADFRLGSGHVIFFYNKLGYLSNRYNELRLECLNRGFNVQDYSAAFNDVPTELLNNWEPDYNFVRPILKERINTRLSTMKVIRYKGSVITLKQAEIC